MATGFKISGNPTSYRLLAYHRERRMLEKRIRYLRNRGEKDDSPKLINRLARLDHLTNWLIPNGEQGRFPFRKSRMPYHCIW